MVKKGRTRISTAPRAAASPKRVRKNIDIDVSKLAEARRILGAPTDTATIDEALDAVVFADAVRSSMEKLAAAGGVADIYETRGSAARRVAEP